MASYPIKMQCYNSAASSSSHVNLKSKVPFLKRKITVGYYNLENLIFPELH